MFSPCAVCEAAGNCIRIIIGCLCCILIGGPVMFIVGVILLVGDNNRADYVSTYNAAVANFNTTGMAAWSSAGTMGETSSPAAFTMQSSSVVVNGNPEDVNTNGVSYYGQNSISWPSTATTSLTFSATTSTPFTRSNIQKSTTYSNDVRCVTSFVTCSVSRMEDLCRDDAGPHAVYTGGSCLSEDRCGTCTNTQYLSTYCAVLIRTSSTTWVESTAHRSCKFPFGFDSQQFDQATAPSNLQLRLFSDDDPLITLEAVTEGTHDFGVTAGEQRRTGIVLLILGIGVTILVCGGLCCIAKSIAGRSREGGSHNNNEDVDGTPMQPQPYHHHNQVPNHYHHQQPHHHHTTQAIPVEQYEQPPTYYNNGQPQGYGQAPPPAPVGYGLPPQQQQQQPQYYAQHQQPQYYAQAQQPAPAHYKNAPTTY